MQVPLIMDPQQMMAQLCALPGNAAPEMKSGELCLFNLVLAQIQSSSLAPHMVEESAALPQSTPSADAPLEESAALPQSTPVRDNAPLEECAVPAQSTPARDNSPLEKCAARAQSTSMTDNSPLEECAARAQSTSMTDNSPLEECVTLPQSTPMRDNSPFEEPVPVVLPVSSVPATAGAVCVAADTPVTIDIPVVLPEAVLASVTSEIPVMELNATPAAATEVSREEREAASEHREYQSVTAVESPEIMMAAATMAVTTTKTVDATAAVAGDDAEVHFETAAGGTNSAKGAVLPAVAAAALKSRKFEIKADVAVKPEEQPVHQALDAPRESSPSAEAKTPAPPAVQPATQSQVKPPAHHHAREGEIAPAARIHGAAPDVVAESAVHAKAVPVAQQVESKAADAFGAVLKQVESDGVETVRVASEDAAPRTAAGAVREMPAPHAAAVNSPREGIDITAAPRQSATMEALPDTVVKSVRLLTANGEKTLSVRLVPPSLGEVHIQVTGGADDSVSVRLMSSNPVVRDALEGQLSGLRETIGRSGLSVTTIAVSVDAGTAQSSGGHFTGGAFSHRQAPPEQFARPDPSPPPQKSILTKSTSMLDVRV